MAQFKQSYSCSIRLRKRHKKVSPQVREQALAASERLINLIAVLEHHIDKLSQAVNTGKKTSLRESQALAKTMLSLHKDLDKYRAILDLPVSLEAYENSDLSSQSDIVGTQSSEEAPLTPAIDSGAESESEEVSDVTPSVSASQEPLEVQSPDLLNALSWNARGVKTGEAGYQLGTSSGVPYYLNFRSSESLNIDRPWRKVWARVRDSITRFQNSFPDTNSRFVEAELTSYCNHSTEKIPFLDWSDDQSQLQEYVEKPVKLEWWQKTYRNSISNLDPK